MTNGLKIRVDYIPGIINYIVYHLYSKYYIVWRLEKAEISYWRNDLWYLHEGRNDCDIVWHRRGWISLAKEDKYTEINN